MRNVLLLLIIALPLSLIGAEPTKPVKEQPLSPTWTMRLTSIFSSTQGRDVSESETELIASMIWLANTDQQAKSNEAKSELSVKLIGQYINEQVNKGAAKQGVLSFQQQLQAVTLNKDN